MSVCLDGSTLSSLLFSHLNGANQYGFLLGEKIEHIEDKISDSQIHTYDINSYLYVSSFIPWPSQHCIYNRGGIIDNERMQSFLSSKEQNIIGWYSFRHNSTSRPSLRETNLHNNLAVTSSFTGQSEDFIFLLCTSSSSADMSIHTCSYGFMQKTDGTFLNLPLTVMNLGDTTRKEYRKKSSTTLFQSQTISGVLQSSQKEFMKSSGEMEHIVKVNHLEQSLNKSLMDAHNKITESEKTLGSLEMDVAGLRQQLLLLEQEEAEIMFHKQEEKRQCELEEQRRHNAQVDAEEQKELEKLLIDLGVSSNDVLCNIQPESLTVESSTGDHGSASAHIVNKALSVPKERAFVKNNDTNANRVADSRSDVDHRRYMNYEQEQCTNSDDVYAHKPRHTRTVKDNLVDTFSFVEDELKFHQSTAAKKQQSCAVRNAGATVAQDQGSGKGLIISSHENTQYKDIKYTGVKPIQTTHNNLLHQDTGDNTYGVPISDALGDLVDLERPQLDPDVCVDRHATSSPVF
ncbi:unnamed protein product [Candidula unifasciata]|uniref:BRCA1-A complex subunit Abraxas 1 n=1 Tax=Candidula unifasciata TaxID=100452 RepID=A0A8S3YJC7_9EUPU|nr:unnamed protein product [Candidula unifasciata]